MVASAGDASPDTSLPDAAWLDYLPRHAIFAPAQGLGSDAARTAHPSAMAVRNADVLVAHGQSLRMTSLLDVKHQGTALHDPSSLRGYKLLTAPALDFEIVRLAVNPTGKLLAVIGTHKVAVVVLPRPGALVSKAAADDTSSGSGRMAASIGVKAATVGAFYHHGQIGGRGRLADVKWHPWGELGSSLLTMTRDGTLR